MAENNETFGLDRIDLCFGGLKERVKRAEMRLNQYISVEIDFIEELDEERLLFLDAKFPAYRRYSSFISVSIG